MTDLILPLAPNFNKRMRDMGDGTHAEVVKSIASNITTKFRDSFETFTPNEKWTQTLGSGDIVMVDGNAAASSYLVISKDPLSAGTETAIDSLLTFEMPTEMSFGASMSQRTLGQEFSFEVVDTGIPLADVPDLEISAITQTTTTLTVTTVNSHGLSVGKSIGIRACSNQLANYPALVVASIPAPNQITCTAGPGGTIASQTITNPAGVKGFVFFRERLGRAQNGVSQIFESPTATTASLYIRSESGDVLPSGTVAGNHGVTVATTASVQLVNSAYQYAFAPTNEFRIVVQADRTQWSDAPIDSLAASTGRLLRTQVCPDPTDTYKLRIRATNNDSLTIPNAQVVSVAKSGTTTGTFTTDVPHDYTTGDLIVYYGSNDVAAANFPALVAATAITVTGANTFTAVIGTGTTGTGFGGYVAKVQGGNLMSALGAVAQSAINATLTTLSDGTRQLVLTGSANWAGVTIGDYANVVGCRTSLVSLGVDGAWKVANVATTALTLVPATAAFAATVPADFVLVTCGGAVIRRTDLRLSFVRLFDYERQRVEILQRPTGDIAGAVPTVPQGGTIATVTGVTTVGTVTTVAAVTTAGTPLAPATPYFVNSLATTNGALVLTGTSGVQAVYATNTGAAAAYVKLYNKATAPTVGTDVPEMVIPVPAAVGGVPGVVELTPGFNGYRFALGLGIAITGAAADADTTAVAAGQVKVKLSRTV